MYLFAFFYMLTFQLDHHHLLKVLSFSIVQFWLLCQISSVHMCVGLFVGLQFNAVCFCTNTMQFLLLLPNSNKIILLPEVTDSDTFRSSFIVQSFFFLFFFFFYLFFFILFYFFFFFFFLLSWVFCFSYEGENCLFKAYKNCAVLLMVNCFDSVDCFW